MRACLLCAKERRIMPWKNGGGFTEEIAIFPDKAGMDDFHWRVSMAQVTTAGPFSAFPGIYRRLMVLNGTMELSVGTSTTIIQTPQSAALEFSGEEKVFARPVEKTVRDLNVMTRAGYFTSSLIKGTDGFRLTAHTTLLVAQTDLSVRTDGGHIHVPQRDVLRLDEPDASWITTAGAYHLITLNKA